MPSYLGLIIGEFFFLIFGRSLYQGDEKTCSGSPFTTRALYFT